MPVKEASKLIISCDRCPKTTSVPMPDGDILCDKIYQISDKLIERGWERIETYGVRSVAPDFRCRKCALTERQSLCKSPNILDRIDGGFYNNKNVDRFKEDALKEVGLLSDSPQSDKAWKFAWSEGHGSGFREVLIFLEKIAQVIK